MAQAHGGLGDEGHSDGEEPYVDGMRVEAQDFLSNW